MTGARAPRRPDWLGPPVGPGPGHAPQTHGAWLKIAIGEVARTVAEVAIRRSAESPTHGVHGRPWRLCRGMTAWAASRRRRSPAVCGPSDGPICYIYHYSSCLQQYQLTPLYLCPRLVAFIDCNITLYSDKILLVSICSCNIQVHRKIQGEGTFSTCVFRMIYAVLLFTAFHIGFYIVP